MRLPGTRLRISMYVRRRHLKCGYGARWCTANLPPPLPAPPPLVCAARWCRRWRLRKRSPSRRCPPCSPMCMLRCPGTVSFFVWSASLVRLSMLPFCSWSLCVAACWVACSAPRGASVHFWQAIYCLVLHAGWLTIGRFVEEQLFKRFTGHHVCNLRSLLSRLPRPSSCWRSQGAV